MTSTICGWILRGFKQVALLCGPCGLCAAAYILLGMGSSLETAFAQTGFTPRIVAKGFTAPTSFAVLPVERGAKRVLIAESAGNLQIVDVASGSSKLVAKVGEGVPGETVRVLDLVVHEDFNKNRQAFISYSLQIDSDTCFFTLEMLGIPEAFVADAPKMRREILREQYRCADMIGGGLAWQNGDTLFVGVGVGREAIGERVAQDVKSVFGKILRLSIAEEPYAVPDDNPYKESATASELVWALGFRDPYRLGYDSTSGRLFVVDRGTGLTEEVNSVTAKGNYGWPVFEGDECQMMRFDCIGKRFRTPVFSIPGRGLSLTGAAALSGKTGTFAGKFLVATTAAKSSLYSIPMAKKGKRAKVSLGFPVDSLGADANGLVYLLSTKAGVLRTLN